MRSKSIRVIGFLCVLLLTLGLAACGDDDSGGDSATGPDPERYCELVADLQKAGNAAFEEVESNKDATDEDFVVAGKAFAASMEEEFEELIDAAPTEIKEDVEMVVAAIQAQAGLGDAVDEEEAAAAEQRVNAWETDNC